MTSREAVWIWVYKQKENASAQPVISGVDNTDGVLVTCELPKINLANYGSILLAHRVRFPVGVLCFLVLAGCLL